MTPEQKLSKLKSILDLLKEDQVTPEQLRTVADEFLKVAKHIQTTLESKVEESNGQNTAQIQGIRASVAQVEKLVSKVHDDLFLDLTEACDRFERDIKGVQSSIPTLPEAAEYQVRVRQKEKHEREARTQERDTTRFQMQIGDETFTDLPKRKLMFYVVREALKKGANPREVLSGAGRWIVVPGRLSSEKLEKRAEAERTEESSEAGLHRFFTADDELFHYEGHTYALTKMWGATTLEQVAQIMKTYKLDHVRYQAISD